MAKSGPELPPRPAQQGVAEPAGAKNAFDGDESTEVMDLPPQPVKAAAPAVEEPPQDVEEKDKKYIAPRVIPAAAVPDKADGAKIVLNIPDARADRSPPAPPSRTRPAEVAGDKPAVAEVRARRRAPTVKIARPNLGEPPGSIDVAMEDDLEPPPPLEKPVENAAPLSPAKGLIQAVPIGLAPPPETRAPASLPVSQRPSGPAHEAPATAIAIQESRPEKSRLPWVLFGALTLGAAAAGVFVATRKPDAGFTAKAPAAQATASVTTASAPLETALPTQTLAKETSPSATETVAANDPPSAEPSVAAPTTTTASAVAVVPPRPVVTYPRPTATAPAYTAPRPPATFPRPTAKKTSDIPSGI